MIEEGSQPIVFYTEDIDFKLSDEECYAEWLQRIVAAKQSEIIQLTFIFCSDDYLLNINRTYLHHDYYTDIITFPYRQGKELESDIFISIDRVADNAAKLGLPFAEELLRVMAHGVLHLLGYKDKTAEEGITMRAQESAAIDLWTGVKK